MARTATGCVDGSHAVMEQDFSHLWWEDEEDEESIFQLRLEIMFASRRLEHRCPMHDVMMLTTTLFLETMHLFQV